MALTGLEIYKLLAKTNCKECGFQTCLAFAMQLAKKAVGLEKCPYISDQAKSSLEASALPPIRLVNIGCGSNLIQAGNESVMFRHEEKFHRPTIVGRLIEDNIPLEKIKEKLKAFEAFEFERVGEILKVNLIVLKQTTKDAKNFYEAAKILFSSGKLAVALLSEDEASLRKTLFDFSTNKPLIGFADNSNYKMMAALSKEFNVPLAARAGDLDSIAVLTKNINDLGINDIVIDIAESSLRDKIWKFTQIRRLALKKGFRALGYPMLAFVDNTDIYQSVLEAATLITKYANILVLKESQAWQVLSILTLRQNIYTDPQKPLQVEPKLYSIGNTNEKSPVLITTNFSLSYYTVLSEVEASKIPSFILSVDTEGMSVLTAWAAEKFTADKIADSLAKSGLKTKINHNRLIIPGYVAVMSGDLEEKSDCKILVGPKEATGIPQFLKNASQ